MRIGVPTEIKSQEFRVGLTPESVAELVQDGQEVWVQSGAAEERAMLRQGQILYTYLHLAPDAPQTEDLIKSGAVCIAYETVTDETGGLPLLKPMSQGSVPIGLWKNSPMNLVCAPMSDARHLLF